MVRHIVPNPPVSAALLHQPPETHTVCQWYFGTRNGFRYRLHAAIPRAPLPADGQPALYLLDGNAAFAALNTADLAAHPGLAVIAIGHETDTVFDFDARSRDYTPAPPSEQGLPEGSPRPARPSGGAAQFLQALADEILPDVERRFPLDRRRRTLWGHSYGGLFALHAYIHAPELFGALCVVSPSLWWGDGMILDALAAVPPRTEPAILLMRGSAEASPATSAVEVRDAFARLEAVLRVGSSPSTSVAVIEGASHHNTLGLSLPSALLLAARQ